MSVYGHYEYCGLCVAFVVARKPRKLRWIRAVGFRTVGWQFTHIWCVIVMYECPRGVAVGLHVPLHIFVSVVSLRYYFSASIKYDYERETVGNLLVAKVR